MRTAFPKPPIALLALAFAICGQNVYGQDGQTPAPAATCRHAAAFHKSAVPQTQPRWRRR